METSTPEAQPEAQPEVQAEQPKGYSLLAKEAFGSEYHGEVVEPEKQETASEPEQQETEEPAQEQETEQPEASEEETTISTLSELLEVEGYDQDQFLNLEVEQKVNGETRKVSLKDLIATNQTLEAAESRLQEAKEKATTQHQALAEKQQELEETVNVAAAVFQKQMDALKAEEEKVDWADLRKNDPGQAAMLKQDFAERREAINSEVNQLRSAYQQMQKKAADEYAEKAQETLKAEQQALLEKLPEWKNEETATKEQKQISEYLATQGLTPEEIANASDHRLVIMARKAMLYDKGQGKAEPVKKKLATVPKMMKPGAPKSQDINQSQEQSLLSKISANPNSLEAQDAGVALLKLRRGTK